MAQYTAETSARGIESTVVLKRHGKLMSAENFIPVSLGTYLYRNSAVTRGTISKLIVIITPPGIESSVRFNCNGKQFPNGCIIPGG